MQVPTLAWLLTSQNRMAGADIRSQSIQSRVGWTLYVDSPTARSSVMCDHVEDLCTPIGVMRSNNIYWNRFSTV